MPIFELQGDGGKTYEVDADDMDKAVAAFKKFGALGARQPADNSANFNDRFDAVSDESAFRDVKPPEKTIGEKLSDTLPGRIAKSIYSAVTLPGDVLAGRAHVPSSDGSLPGSVPYGAPESSGERIAELAFVANPAAAALRGGQNAFGATSKPANIVPKVAETVRPAPSVSELKNAAKAQFEAPEVAALEISAPTMKSFAEKTKASLANQGFDQELTPEVFNILGRLEKAPADAFVTGSNLQSIRRVLGKAAESTDPTKRAAASSAIDALDDFLPTIAQNQIQAGDLPAAIKTLQSARANWAAAKHAEAIDKKTIQAELRAAATNSGRNVSNTIRQRMADILIDDRKKRGFNADELAQMETIVRGTRAQNVMRTAGNILGGGGGLGTLASGAAGVAATGGISGLALPATGFAMKALSNNLTIRQAAKLSEMIRSRAPLAKAMADFEAKAAEAAASTTAKNNFALKVAANKLAERLGSSGIPVTAKELLDQH